MAWSRTSPTHVPTRVRAQALARDGHQCTATMRDGTRCVETVKLEAHHVEGWQPGERTTADMLVTLCSWHHRRITEAQAAAARRRQPRPSSRHPSEKHPGFL